MQAEHICEVSIRSRRAGNVFPRSAQNYSTIDTDRFITSPPLPRGEGCYTSLHDRLVWSSACIITNSAFLAVKAGVRQNKLFNEGQDLPLRKSFPGPFFLSVLNHSMLYIYVKYFNISAHMRLVSPLTLMYFKHVFKCRKHQSLISIKHLRVACTCDLSSACWCFEIDIHKRLFCIHKSHRLTRPRSSTRR